MLSELPPELHPPRFIVAANSRTKMRLVLSDNLLERNESGKIRMPRTSEANGAPKKVFRCIHAEVTGSFTLRVTLVAGAPAAIDSGVSVYVAPGGNPLTDSETADGNVTEPFGLNVSA